MGTVFIESINTRVLITNLLILIAFIIIMPNRLIIATSCFVTLMASYFIASWIESKIKGMTGDTCGFIIEISQIIFMILVLFLKG